MNAATQSSRGGLVAAIGGNEDRDGQRRVLRALLEGVRRCTGAERPRVGVMSAASGEPAVLWSQYETAFASLGASSCWLDIRERAQADQAQLLDALAQIDLLFMTGGDQSRLMQALGGTRFHQRLQERHQHDGLSIAGTSAGASALGSCMPNGEEGEQLLVDEFPGRTAVPGAGADSDAGDKAAGLRLWPGLLLDQHVAQRHRHARLFNLLQRHPQLVGVGIDEDTVLMALPDGEVRVVGAGVVTVIDGRRHAPARVGDAPADVLSWSGLDLLVMRDGTVLPPVSSAAPSAASSHADVLRLLARQA